MNLQLDQYAYLDTPMHRWDPRFKIIALVALIFSFSFVQDFRLVPLMLAISALLYILAKLPVSFLLTRMRIPGLFLLTMGIILPFLSGQTVLLHLGPLAVRQEGCLDFLMIASKFICILTVSFVIFGTTPFLTTVKAMRSLGLPFILADMTLFAYRYLFEIGKDLKTMQTSMKLRGFRSSPRRMATLAALAGTILVRGYEQSERVYRAVALRGYGQPASFEENFQPAYSRGYVGLVAVIMVAVVFVAAEILLHAQTGV
jgi:cobalt/nickel transport system permease protein